METIPPQARAIKKGFSVSKRHLCVILEHRLFTRIFAHLACPREVILAAVQEVDGAPDDPAPDVVVKALGSSSIDLQIRVWIDSADQQHQLHFSVVEASKMALDRAGVEIPFPHLQPFVDSAENRIWKRTEQLADHASSAEAAPKV